MENFRKVKELITFMVANLGATVATTDGERSFALLKTLGVDVLISYETEDF